MSASICRDTFVIAIVADLDCFLEITGYKSPEERDLRPGESPELTFDLEPGNEAAFEFVFDYYLGTGFDDTHTDFGFSAEIDDLAGLHPSGGSSNTGNAASMSFGGPTFNPPTPDTTEGPRTLHTASVRYTAAATSVIHADAVDQNIGGTVTLNTGRTP